VRVKRGGWTLHEMLISLSVMAVAAALASHAAVVHMRFFRGAGEIIAARGQIGAVGSVFGATLWGIAPGAGEILFASDSAVEVLRPVGSSVVCESQPGRITLPAPQDSGNTLSAFESAPETGDAIAVFVDDSVASGWLRATIASVEDGSCVAFPQPGAALALILVQPLAFPTGSPVRVLRPVRLSHYRASDGLWYLGVRDWNGATQRLNTIQPVAGPIEPHSGDQGKSGLVIRYFDSSAVELQPPDPMRVALVSVLARGRSRRPAIVAGMVRKSIAFIDSTETMIALRNAR
jgi:hypothetical protein